jgi:hypothetical protein
MTHKGCQYYGYSPLGMPTWGNQCALVIDCHAPCAMEIAGQQPDELQCDRVLLATLERIQRETREVQ